MNQLHISQNDITDNWSIDRHPDVLTDFYNPDVSIAIWQRKLPDSVKSYLAALIQSPKKFTLKTSGGLNYLMSEIQRIFPPAIIGAQETCISAAEFYTNIHQILEMFSCLFDAKILGLRINTLDTAMCPRFHTDKVGVRLITTYYGPATEWLPSAYADRSALAGSLAGEIGRPGAIIEHERYIQRLNTGDIALLKGELWEGNDGRGLIHRSPTLTEAQTKRLVLTCDLIE